MAIPSIPADVSAGNTTAASHMNSLLDVLAWLRNSKPLWRGQAIGAGGAEMSGASEDVANDTVTTLGFGLAGSLTAEDYSVGTWTSASADSDPESLVVPEAGHYLIVVHTQWEANSPRWLAA